MAQKILFKRGLKANLPTLQVGEPAFCIDTGEYVIGSPAGNVVINGAGSIGLQGPKGDNGIDGKSAYDLWISAGNTGTVQTFLNSLKGAKGDTGAQGPQGIRGLTGDRGEDGQNGIDGKSAYQLWLDAGNTGTLQNFLDSLKGPKGDTGDAGTGTGGSVPSNVILFEDWVSGETVTIDGATPADTTAPNDVTNLTYTNVTQTGLRLTWTASSSSDVASYRIFEGATQIGSATVNQLDITGLTANTTHTYTVKAVDNAGNVSAGVSVTVTTSAATPTNTAPSITSSYSTTSVNDSTSISIPYTVTDAEGGMITATLTKDGTPTTATIATGANTWNVGTLAVGSHVLTIQVADSAGLTSNTLTFNLTVTATSSLSGTASPAPGMYSSGQTITLSATGASGAATIYYTTNGLTPTTASTVYSTPINLGTTGVIKFIVKDAAGNTTPVQAANYIIGTGTGGFYSFSGASTDYIKVSPAIAFDEVIMDFTPKQAAGAWQYYIDARTGVANGYIARTSSNTDEVGTAYQTVSVNGTTGTSATAFVPTGTRNTLRAVLKATGTDDVQFFKPASGSGSLIADVYDIQFKLAGNVVAHYDFTKNMGAGTTSGQIIPDISGNGNVAFIYGTTTTWKQS